MKLLYIVHDLHNSAVIRRVQMFHAAGIDVTVAGFRRRDEVPATVAGAPAIDLGRTQDAKFVQRVAAVLRNVALPGRLLAAARGCDVIVGRNLEALALALRARKAAPEARMVYECLDIHRLLLGSSKPAKLLQAIEARMLAHVDLVLTSSPAFERDYFAHRPTLRAPVMLLENKLLVLEGAPPQPLAPPAGPPWVIAWFGMLRCAKTLDILAALAAKHGGAIEVHIAGRPSPAVFEDFEARVAAAAHLRYLGPYTAADLPRLYQPCHFAWAIDYFEEGLNSKWLLPNRLYEATSFGAVPIALHSVETGKWLDAHRAGLTIDDDLAGLDALGTLSPERYAGLREDVAAIPQADLTATIDDCRALRAALEGKA
ncbi:glycosyltransferase [Sphingomonas sp. MMS12-HWE2-04]|uniref:glycosyltransferase n=1 Tax=Sphingomonas sp. MMS12-HWE2-04 TaxID=3234199 RepID=UPI00384E23B3